MSIMRLLNYGKHVTWFNIPTLLSIILMIVSTIICSIFNLNPFSSFSVITLLSASIAGLSFTLALLTAINNIFLHDDLLKLYKFYCKHKDDNESLKYAFFEIFAPYVWIAILFSMSAFISIIGGIFDFNSISNQFFL